MTWVRIDDAMPDHEKLNDVSAEAGWLHVCGLAFCSRNLTDGLIDDGKVPGLLSGKKSPSATRKLLAQLVSAGLWEPREGAWEIHDYLKYNPSKADVLAKREATRQRVEKARAAKAVKEAERASGNGVGNALHEGIGDGRNAAGNGVTDGDVTLLVTPAPAPAPSDSGSGFVRTDLGDVTDVGASGAVTEADEEQRTPEARAVSLLVRDGKTEAGALELVREIGAEAVLVKLSAEAS